MIKVRILGTAAGGGLPQWNCECENCRGAREGKWPARTQSSVALSADGKAWFLVNASPDLRSQIESTPELQPVAGTGRESPIHGVLFTNADMDHILGVLLLREGARLQLSAPSAVRAALDAGLGLTALLNSFCGVDWHEPAEDFQEVRLRDGTPSGLLYRAIPLPGSPPPFARGGGEASSSCVHSVALQFATSETGPRLLIAPDVAKLTAPLQAALRESAVALIDGTFWHDDELKAFRPNAKTSRAMGHVPISGSGGSLEFLRTLPAGRRLYLHINNTNPILRPDSPERTEILAAGLEVAEDGLEFDL